MKLHYKVVIFFGGGTEKVAWQQCDQMLNVNDEASLQSCNFFWGGTEKAAWQQCDQMLE